MAPTDERRVIEAMAEFPRSSTHINPELNEDSPNSGSRKRKRSLPTANELLSSDEETSSCDEETSSCESATETILRSLKKKRRHKFVTGVRLPGLIHPASLYMSHEPAAVPDYPERDVLRSALVRLESSDFLQISMSSLK